ncbi:uncharacterized protein LOC108697440 [Xenopus laevis]|uniref:Secreted protein n=2 Tax=Xenopus laevis TaxID=8355 RepID=A0A974H9Q3_XENLA|nr:uncharacterized protein LOC108697440 [Xenopus laevis]OCT70067.1 hypothetical protein XELAEV_18036988mg [Xenopus laevis]
MSGASIKYILLGALMVIFIGALAEGVSVRKERKIKGKCQPEDKNCVENKVPLSNTKLKTSKAKMMTSLLYDLPFDNEPLGTDESGSGYETDVGSGGETDAQHLQELKASNKKESGKKRINLKRFNKK